MKCDVFLLFSAASLVFVSAAPEIKKTITIPSVMNAPKKANESPRQSHCHSNQFECSNGQCISKSLTCNDRNDCGDNSDESFSVCFSPGGKATTTTTTPRYTRYMEISISNHREFTCSNGEFLCTSGECILQNLVCNGRQDCRDGSDEESPICNNNGGDKRRCHSSEFRCNSGECIDIVLRCDGSNDCYDSSDENFAFCERIGGLRHETPSRSERIPSIPLESSSSNIWGQKLTPCNVPAQPANGRWKLHRSLCDSNHECQPPASLRSMGPGSYLVYSCDQGFALNGSRDVLCGPGGQWIHEPRCDEIRCHDLSSSATEAICTWNNVAVSCEIPAPIGTTAQLRCREGFVQGVMYEQSFKNVKCQTDGNWNPKPIQCVKKPKKVKLVLEGDIIFED